VSYRRYNELEDELSQPGLANSDMARIGKQMSELSGVVSLMHKRDELIQSVAELRAVENEELAKDRKAKKWLHLPEVS